MSIKYFYSAGENEIYTNKDNDDNKYNTIKSCLSSNVILNEELLGNTECKVGTYRFYDF